MQVQLLLFGIVADLVGKSSLELQIPQDTTVEIFKKILTNSYPQLESYTSYAVAINETYAQNKDILKNEDVVAIIPPVSGG